MMETERIILRPWLKERIRICISQTPFIAIPTGPHVRSFRLRRAGFITGENICIDGGMTKLMIYHGNNGWILKQTDNE